MKRRSKPVANLYNCFFFPVAESDIFKFYFLLVLLAVILIAILASHFLILIHYYCKRGVFVYESKILVHWEKETVQL